MIYLVSREGSPGPARFASVNFSNLANVSRAFLPVTGYQATPI